MAKAETRAIDSLDSLLDLHQQHDTLRVNLLINSARKYKYINPKKTYSYAIEAGQISDSLNYYKGEADAYDLISGYYAIASNFEKVIEFAQKSYDINAQIDNKFGMAKNIRDIGNIYYFQGDVHMAINYLEQALTLNTQLNDSLSMSYNHASLGTDYCDIGQESLGLDHELKALSIAEAINNEEAIAYATNNLGVVYEVQGNYPLALDCYKKSLLLDEKFKNHRGAAIVASNIALIYTLLEEYDNALNYCYKGIEHAEEIGFKTGLVYNYESLGQAYQALEAYEKAWDALSKTLSLQQEIGNLQGVAIGYRNLGTLLLVQNKFNQAEIQFQKALEVAKSISLKRIETACYLGFATILYEQGNYHRAINFGSKALDMAKESNIKSLTKQSAETLSKCYNKTGQYKEAYHNYILYKQISDSLYNEENIKEIARLEYHSKLEKEKEIHELEQQRKDKEQAIALKKYKYVRNTFIVGFLLLLLLLFVAIKSFVQKRNANRVLKIKNLKIEKQALALEESNRELQQLSQFKEDMTNMIVHDLKSPISSIINITTIPEDARRIEIAKHSGYRMMNLVQNILDVYKSQSTSIQLNKEEFDLRNCINMAVEEVNFIAKYKKLSIQIKMDTPISINADQIIVRRVLSNLLSNAVKFSSSEASIIIDCQMVENQQLKLSIQNYGSFIPKEKQVYIFEKFGQLKTHQKNKYSSTGLGLTFCKLAVRAHQGTIGVNSSEKDGTTFWFTLPNAIANKDQSKKHEAKGNNDRKVSLSEEEKKGLHNVYKNLEALGLSEITSFAKIFETIASNNLGNKQWIKALEKSIYDCDELAYKNLVKLIIE